MIEATEMRDKPVGVAAFFDLDGTLLPLPSLEKRFFRMLRYRREIPLKNYFLWILEALRLLPHGIRAIAHGDKMYLSGVKSFDESAAEDSGDSSAHAGGRPALLPSQRGASQAAGQASGPSLGRARRNPRCPVPQFFEAGVERVAWHARRGHTILLVSGTLEPLAKMVAQALEAKLAARGVAAKIRVCATKLEESQGRWTGRIVGEAMFGEAKARAAKQLARELQLDLSCCHAYGDNASDRWLLASVGKPVAVNASRSLARIARKRGWPVLHWSKERNPMQRRREHTETEVPSGASKATQGEHSGRIAGQADDLSSRGCSRTFQEPLRNAERC